MTEPWETSPQKGSLQSSLRINISRSHVTFTPTSAGAVATAEQENILSAQQCSAPR